MRQRTATFALALLAFVPLACESTPPAVAPTAAPPKVASVANDTGPAPEPADIVGTIRWKNPGATVQGLSTCAGLPPQLGDGGGRALLELMFGETLHGEVDAKQLAGVVAVDAPADAVFSLDPTSKRPHVLAAWSIGVTSFERAKAAAETSAPLNEVQPGIFRIGDKQRDITCVLANSAGAAPARLVCGPKEKDVIALTPYLTRTTPTLPSPVPDLHAEFRWTPIDARFGQEIRQGLRGLPLIAGQAAINEPHFDKALGEAAAALPDEIAAEASDLDKVNLDLSVDPGACLTVSGGLQLRGRASWLVKTLTDRPERQGAPPAIFWRAPKDSDSAFYSRGGDPAHYGDILRVLRAMAEGGLVHNGVADADAKAVADLLTFVAQKDVNSVSASGHLSAPPAKLTNAKPQQVMDAMTNAYVGWYLVGVDNSGDAFAKWLRDVVNAYNRPGIQKPLKTELHSDAKHLPVVKIVAAPAQLGRGAIDVEIRVNELDAPDVGKGGVGKKPEHVTFVGHLMLMIDGKGAWLGFGANRDELVKRMVSVKTGSPDAGTLAARPGLDPLKNGKFLSAGFLTIVPMTRAIGTGVGIYADAMGGGPPQLADVMNALNNMPHKGETPIFVTSSIAGTNTPRVDVSFNVTKGTIEDLGTLIAAGMRVYSQLH